MEAYFIDRYLDIYPIHHDSFLTGVTTSEFSPDSLKTYWDKLLGRSNFTSPFISFAEQSVVENFLRVLICRGILERVENPCDSVLHPVIVIQKKENSQMTFSY